MDLQAGIQESIENLSPTELKELLEKKKNLYDEIKKEMEFTLKNAGHHLPGNTRDKYERELKIVEHEINQIQTALDE